MGHARLSLTLLLLLGASFLAGGCATKGFVRNEVGDLQAASAQERARLDRELAALRNSSEEALARADLAFGEASDAREMALGRIGLHEVGQYTALFGFDSDDIGADAQATLDEAARLILEHPEVIVDVYGFADPTGDARYNIQLGQRRADAVVRYLLAKTPGQLSRYAAVSYGEAFPLTNDSTRSSRPKNRRVMVSIIERSPLTASPASPEPARSDENQQQEQPS
jgi:outer membrane protein OmpA-like peptidoglycan-associated protein